jgi:protein-S-isoprenylcysteine O-methyltransferase Ste14
LPDLRVGLAFAFLILSRLAYVVGTGYMLVQQDRHQSYTRRYGLEGGFQRFKRVSTILMVFDTGSFILLNLLTIDTMHLPVPRWSLIVFGAALGLLGLGVKTWATRILGPRAYYWYNFFEPAEPVQWVPRGPYKYLNNPMYGVGYLQTYGLAFMCSSLYGMIAALFMQVTIFVFNAMVEVPHFRALARAGSGDRAAGSGQRAAGNE